MSRLRQRCNVSVIFAGFLMAASHASAGSLCEGTYTATSVHTLPQDSAINFPIVEISGASRVRSLAFRSGLEDSGLKTNDNSSLQLQLLISIALPRKGAAPSRSGSNEHLELDWQPVETAFAGELKDPRLQGAALSLTAVLNNDADHRM